MESMGRRIRALRKTNHLSQWDLAKALGIDQSTVSDIENDKNDAFSGKVLLKMSEVLGQSPFFLVYGLDIPARGLTAEEAELLLAFRRASKPERSALLTLARAIAPPPPGPPPH